MPKFSFKPSDDPLARIMEPVAKEAARISSAHLKRQQGIPEELMHSLLMAEVNCRAHNGRLRPVAQVDDSEDCYEIPLGVVLIDFLMECMRRHAAHHVHCSLIADDGNLVVAYLSKEKAWTASCPLDHSPDGVVLGDWSVQEEHLALGAPHSKAKSRRNAPCPCGSGKKYKKCCGRGRSQESNAPTDTVSEADFAHQLIAAIRQVDATADVDYDPDQSVLLRDGQPHFNLQNSFGEFSAAPVWHREEVLRKCVRVWFNPSPELPKSFEDVQPDLLPSIVPRGRYENSLRPEKDQRIHTIIGEHFAASLVYDHRDTMAHLSSNDLREWKVSRDVAFSAALRNLRQISLPPSFSMHIKGVFVAAYQDDYDPSRLLLPELICSLNVTGDPVVMIPNRRTLIIAGSDDPAGLSAMADLAKRALDQPWSISGIPLRLRAGDWQPYQPLAGHPAYGKLRELWLRSMQEAYAQQVAVLGSETQTHGIHVFVNSYFVFPESGSQSAWSQAVWSNGLPSLIPRTDMLGIIADPPTTKTIDAEGLAAFRNCEKLTLDWGDAYSLLSDLMLRTDDYPERYLIRGKCEGERLARLRSLDRSNELKQRCAGGGALGGGP